MSSNAVAAKRPRRKFSGSYSEKLRDPRWQKKRLQIMERDEFTCRDTSETGETLNVHHSWYAKGDPWDTPDEFLLTLSETAHKERQALEDRAKKALGLIMASNHMEPLEELTVMLEGLARLSSELAGEDGLGSIYAVSQGELECAWCVWWTHCGNIYDIKDRMCGFEGFLMRSIGTGYSEKVKIAEVMVTEMCQRRIDQVSRNLQTAIEEEREEKENA